MSRVLRIWYSTRSSIVNKDKSNSSKLECQKVSKKRYSRVSTRVSKYLLSTLVGMAGEFRIHSVYEIYKPIFLPWISCHILWVLKLTKPFEEYLTLLTSLVYSFLNWIRYWSTVCLIFLYTPLIFLEIRVIIKILKNPCCALNVD